jgi:hypothetical protein
MVRQMVRQIVSWTDGCLDRQTNEQKVKCLNRWLDQQMD